MNRVWTEEELDILRRDRAAKVPVPVTAAKLGRPVPATYARARLIGTLVQPHQPWDEASVAHLRELVSADPPMTDKRIAEKLGRTVTQIRWKMQDLGLIGVRDLSKLAKNTASEMIRPKAAKPLKQEPVQDTKPAPQKRISAIPAAVPARATAAALTVVPAPTAPAPIDPRAALERALKRLEATLAERLKNSVAEAEAGMVRAAMDAIAEKRRIDQHLADLGKRIDDAQAEGIAKAERVKAEAIMAEAAASSERRTDDVALPIREGESPLEKPKRAAAKPAIKKPVVPAAQGVSQAAAPRQMKSPASPPTPKIVVVETSMAARPESGADPAPAQVSGRGGWKSVRRDPARVMAQAKAKAKATNRADAVDLAQAAQAAIERFIAERGVTKTETNGIQTLVSRLQARGYIVVQDGDGWVIDQRRRIVGESALIEFAEARGISLDVAA
ncbi:hypothetical protein DC522_16500 [Microvirga sp. KLBC 81]|uniref:hypothetical protein n=1 Tax=Microvirga sp. KLBC 81 TaxID=1862707 RepID=UPI000D5232D5|nr:hypothetical protein [Microvirga sp. KLBC 81]PVE23334.1 hypothetical protein DC522_16500 [Microvirga sp. KLBC 81]